MPYGTFFFDEILIVFIRRFSFKPCRGACESGIKFNLPSNSCFICWKSSKLMITAIGLPNVSTIKDSPLNLTRSIKSRVLVRRSVELMVSGSMRAPAPSKQECAPSLIIFGATDFAIMLNCQTLTRCTSSISHIFAHNRPKRVSIYCRDTARRLLSSLCAARRAFDVSNDFCYVADGFATCSVECAFTQPQQFCCSLIFYTLDIFFLQHRVETRF